MSLEPKPPRKASPQIRLVLDRATRAYLREVGRRTGLPERMVVDRLAREAQELEREVTKMGFKHVGEALAELRALRWVLDRKEGK